MRLWTWFVQADTSSQMFAVSGLCLVLLGVGILVVLLRRVPDESGWSSSSWQWEPPAPAPRFRLFGRKGGAR